MGFKQTNNPIKQMGLAANMVNGLMNQQNQQLNNPSAGMIPRPQTPINPKAFSNPGTIANMYGNAMPGTFNRSMGNPPLMQTTDPMTGQVIDPTMDQSTAGFNPVIQGDTAAPPPAGVELPIAPIYDINQ